MVKRTRWFCIESPTVKELAVQKSLTKKLTKKAATDAPWRLLFLFPLAGFKPLFLAKHIGFFTMF